MDILTTSTDKEEIQQALKYLSDISSYKTFLEDTISEIIK